MKIVQDEFVKRLLDFTDQLVFKAKVKINGKWQEYDIFKTIIKENVIRKYIYIEDESGLVEEAQLLTNDNKVLAVKPYEIEKDQDGLVLTFQFEVKVTEVNLGYIDSVYEE